jgi:hypothetical protein
MEMLVAVDPGGVHVGVAVFKKKQRGWTCDWAGEMTPVLFEDWLAEKLHNGEIEILVVEEWKLFADKAAQQIGSHMETSQLIGSIKYIVRTADLHWPSKQLKLEWQSPNIKIPTRSVLRARGIKSTAKVLKVSGDHASDAELHGYHYIMRTLDQPVA